MLMIMECDQYTNDELEKWAEKFAGIPATLLSSSFRMKMSRVLNIPGEFATFSSQGVLQNWMGLAECFGYSTHSTAHLENEKDTTSGLLKMWEQSPDATIQDLILALLEMERYDILEQPDSRTQLEKHIQVFHRMRQKQDPGYCPIQDATVDSSDSPPKSFPSPQGHSLTSYKRKTDHHVDETKFLTTWEGYYDAFISYSHGDWWFVEHLIHALEVEPYNQRLCIADRDLLAGTAELSAIATLVTKRCRRVVVVLSPNFVDCPMCDFTVKYTASLSPGARSKKMIPVMIQDCELLPPVITFITMLHYTRDDANRWFWERLAMSLTVPLDPSEVEISDKSLFHDTCLLKCEDLSGKIGGGKKDLPLPGVSAKLGRKYPSTKEDKREPLPDFSGRNKNTETSLKTKMPGVDDMEFGAAVDSNCPVPGSDEEMPDANSQSSSKRCSVSASASSLSDTEVAQDAVAEVEQSRSPSPVSLPKSLIRKIRGKKKKHKTATTS